MLPKFSRGQWIWVVIFIIIALLVLAPDAHSTMMIKQMLAGAAGAIGGWLTRSA